MLRASVPETSVDEDRDPRPGEQDVRTTPPIERQRMVDQISQSAGVESPTDSELRSGVTPSVRLHRRPSGLRRCWGNLLLHRVKPPLERRLT